MPTRAALAAAQISAGAAASAGPIIVPAGPAGPAGPPGPPGNPVQQPPPAGTIAAWASPQLASAIFTLRTIPYPTRTQQDNLNKIQAEEDIGDFALQDGLDADDLCDLPFTAKSNGTFLRRQTDYVQRLLNEAMQRASQPQPTPAPFPFPAPLPPAPQPGPTPKKGPATTNVLTPSGFLAFHHRTTLNTREKNSTPRVLRVGY